MKAANVLKHAGIVIAGILIIAGIPFVCLGGIGKLSSQNTDVVSSASLIIDQPSGEYVVLINKTLHQDKDNFNAWVEFFSGGESSVIFEDIACSVSRNDPDGLEAAESFQSRLPENQMTIYPEETTLLMSRFDEGLFDIIIMSKEIEEAYHAETGYTADVEHIELVKDGS